MNNIEDFILTCESYLINDEYAAESILKKIFKKPSKENKENVEYQKNNYSHIFDNCLNYEDDIINGEKKITDSDILKIALSNNDHDAILEFIKMEYGNDESIRNFIEEKKLVPVITMETGEHTWYSLKNKRLYDEVHGSGKDTFTEKNSWKNMKEYYEEIEKYQTLESYLISEDDIALESGIGAFFITALIISAIGGTGSWLKNRHNKDNKTSMENKSKLPYDENSMEIKNKKEMLNTLGKEKYKEKTEKDVKNDVRKIVQKLKNDIKVKEHIQSITDKLNKDNTLGHKIQPPTLVYNDRGDYIEIIHTYQEVAVELSNIITDIAKILREKYAFELHNNLLKIGTGDGDEGCLYIN